MVRPFIVIQVSESQRRQLESVLTPKQVRQALFQAVKRTTNTGRVQIGRRVREEINITKKYTDRAIEVPDPKGDVPIGIISISQRIIPLIAYRPKVSKRGGVRATLSKHKAPLVLRHAFRGTVKTVGTPGEFLFEHEGHEGIFLRTKHLPTKGFNKGKGKLTARGFTGRLAIRQQYGPSVLSILGEFGTTKVAMEEFAKLQSVLEKNVESQFRRFTL